MTNEQIKDLRDSLNIVERARRNKETVDKILSRIGEEGRLGDKGKWQNTISCKLQVALQYTTGCNNYWGDDILNREFNKVVSLHFDSLLKEAVANIDEEYDKAVEEFDMYTVTER